MVAKIKDVATEANVSIATVSRVINNVPLVNESTRQRVLEAIKKTGYRPNAIARSLKLQRTDTIGIIIHDIEKPYYTMIARGVEDVCRSLGYNIILCNCDSNIEKEEESLDLFYQKQCDGIIYIGKDFTDVIRNKISYMNMPFVLGGVEDEEDEYSSIINDNIKSCYELCKYLVSQGHKKIGFINEDEKSSYSAKKRRQGFDLAGGEFNIENKDEWNVITDASIKGGFDGMEKILKCQDRPSAVICTDDELGVGAMRAAENAGIKIPEDISIVGFNNVDLGKWNNPSLTSVNNYGYDLGAICARLLTKLIKGEEVKENKVIVTHQIVHGNSVK